VAETKPFFQRIARGALVLAYASAAAWFLWACAQFYLPGQGFTYLIMFGDRDAAHFVPELKAVNHYEIPNSDGYDATHYAQIAMHPQLRDPVLREAVDSLPYRARRILFSWTAYALALGNPARALHIYAVQNIAVWVLLAALMLRWFPATRWENFFRWAGVLFSFGLCFSVRASLVDGPSLLLIATGVALAEAGRPWWSAALLGVSGLGKETNILAGAALAPAELSRRAWLQVFLRAALVALPLALWLLTLQRWLGDAMDSGYRNFAPPFVAYIGKWNEILAGLRNFGFAWEQRGSLLIVISLTAQFLFFASWPRWRETWWRVGAAYALLMAVLGEAVWEGYPGAASRVLLPMALAFNILVPRGWRWWPVLLLGNLTFLVTPDALQPPARDSYEVSGPRTLRIADDNGHIVKVTFDEHWYGPERSRREYWQWSRGDAALTIHNPHPFPVLTNVSFGLRAHGERTVAIRQGARELWRGTLKARELKSIRLPQLRLEPGENRWDFETDRPGAPPDNGDVRDLAFSLRNFQIELTDRVRADN
jgi:hypothetical protein